MTAITGRNSGDETIQSEHEARSGEYSGWSMKFALILALNAVTNVTRLMPKIFTKIERND